MNSVFEILNITYPIDSQPYFIHTQLEVRIFKLENFTVTSMEKFNITDILSTSMEKFNNTDILSKNY